MIDLAYYFTLSRTIIICVYEFLCRGFNEVETQARLSAGVARGCFMKSSTILESERRFDSLTKRVRTGVSQPFRISVYEAGGILV